MSYAILFGQKIVQMNGTYDLDGDKMLEFIALELNPEKDIFPKLVRYYEVDSDGYQTIVWEFIPPIATIGMFVILSMFKLESSLLSCFIPLIMSIAT